MHANGGHSHSRLLPTSTVSHGFQLTVTRSEEVTDCFIVHFTLFAWFVCLLDPCHAYAAKNDTCEGNVMFSSEAQVQNGHRGQGEITWLLQLCYCNFDYNHSHCTCKSNALCKETVRACVCVCMCACVCVCLVPYYCLYACVFESLSLWLLVNLQPQWVRVVEYALAHSSTVRCVL